MSKIVVIGLGPGGSRHLTLEAARYLSAGRPLFFRTMKHPVAQKYNRGRGFISSFDRLYHGCNDFNQVYRAITVNLVRAARLYNTVYYAVPGHPAAGEATVEMLRRICPRLGIRMEIISGISFLEPLLDSLGLDLFEGISVHDAFEIDNLREPCRKHLILVQVFSRSLASRVKLQLLELYPASHPAVIVRAAGMSDPNLIRVPLSMLDRRPVFNHRTSVYIPPFRGQTAGDLLAVMARLRSDHGCPWDRQQTHQSLRQYLVEEAYEVVTAIDQADDHSLKEELGDLLLQVVFHSCIAAEENRFNFYDITAAIVKKLIRRHPHVFGRETAENAAQVKKLWEQIKLSESNSEHKRAAFPVDPDLPALLRAYKLQKKAAEIGFDWPSIGGPLEKAREELAELEEACARSDREAMEEELGDYLFTIVNIARFLKVNPELALGKTNLKFIRRFQHVLDQAGQRGRSPDSFSLEELDRWWEEAKKIR